MTTKKWLRHAIAACVAMGSLIASTASEAAYFSKLIVFGDSTVDSGYYRALPSPGGGTTYNAYWAAAVAAGAGAPTSSPGQVYPQVLASYFGLKADPANQGGTNFATSGAKNIDINTSENGGFKSAIPIATQIENYLSASGGLADPNALFLVSSGGNDISFAIGRAGAGPYPNDPSAYLTTAATGLATAIARLKNAGAQTIVVAKNQPSSTTGTNVIVQYAVNFSETLFSTLTNQGVNYITADVYSVMLSIFSKPASYGFTSTSTLAGHTACTAPPGVTTAWGLLCSSNPNSPSTFSSANADQTNLYADDQHLSTAGQKIIADYVYKLLLQSGAINFAPANCLFNWAEKTYSQVLSPAGATSMTSGVYYFRWYPGTQIYVGISSVDSHVYYLPAGGSVADLGLAQSWFQVSGCQ